MLTDLGVPFLRWLTVTVGDFHGYLEAWCDVLGVSTGGQGPIGHWSVPDGDRLVTDEKSTCHGG